MSSRLKTGIIASTISLMALAACGGNSTADDPEGGGKLVVAGVGGGFQEAQSAAFMQPFSKASGTKVVEASQDSTIGNVKAQVESKTVQWDVVDLSSIDAAIAAKQGLLEPIEYSVVTSGEDLLPGTNHEFYVGMAYSSNVITWKEGEWGDAEPQGAKDFWDLERFPGQRGMKGGTPVFALEFALLADGVAKADLYPLDVDRAFKKLDEIKDSTTFWASNEEGMQLLTAGQIKMGYPPNGRVYNAIEEGQPLEYTWTDGTLFLDAWAVPKGAPNKDAAMKFLEFASQSENQVELAKRIPYGPTNENTVEGLPADRQEVMPTGPDNIDRLFAADEAWWEANLAEVSERWQTWLTE
jgi:putative spermidine/putrescine transport system substrate-binding protein